MKEIVSGKVSIFSYNYEKVVNIFAVCDGMGGEAFGEEASLIAVQTLKKYNKVLSSNILFNLNNLINSYIYEINTLVCKKINENNGKRIGTTLALMVIQKQSAITYNIGDSKVFLFRNNKLLQISEDHTEAKRLVKMGLLTNENIKTHPGRNKLTQHIGIFPDEMILQPYVSDEIKLELNDLFLLCSDGLTDSLSSESISNVLMKFNTCADMTYNLINAALKNGCKDNITVIVIKIIDNKSKKLLDSLKNTFKFLK